MRAFNRNGQTEAIFCQRSGRSEMIWTRLRHVVHWLYQIIGRLFLTDFKFLSTDDQETIGECSYLTGQVRMRMPY